MLEALLWKTGKQLAISEHGARSCVYAEGEAVVHKHKAGPEEVKRQLDFYRAGERAFTSSPSLVLYFRALFWFCSLFRVADRI